MFQSFQQRWTMSFHAVWKPHIPAANCNRTLNTFFGSVAKVKQRHSPCPCFEVAPERPCYRSLGRPSFGMTGALKQDSSARLTPYQGRRIAFTDVVSFVHIVVCFCVIATSHKLQECHQILNQVQDDALQTVTVHFLYRRCSTLLSFRARVSGRGNLLQIPSVSLPSADGLGPIRDDRCFFEHRHSIFRISVGCFHLRTSFRTFRTRNQEPGTKTDLSSFLFALYSLFFLLSSSS